MELASWAILLSVKPRKSPPKTRIAELILERGAVAPAAFTRLALAQRLGVTPDMIRRWEQGLAFPRERMARRLARELNVDAGELTKPPQGRIQGTGATSDPPTGAGSGGDPAES
jgi:transcriptional regulator with XRE-family HTH domain